MDVQVGRSERLPWEWGEMDPLATRRVEETKLSYLALYYPFHYADIDLGRITRAEFIYVPFLPLDICLIAEYCCFFKNCLH